MVQDFSAGSFPVRQEEIFCFHGQSENVKKPDGESELSPPVFFVFPDAGHPAGGRMPPARGSAHSTFPKHHTHTR